MKRKSFDTGASELIVLHVVGPDKPGVTARLTEIIAAEQASLVDIGQSVLHGHLILSAIVDIPPNSLALRRLLFAISELGLSLEVRAFQSSGDPSTNTDSASPATPALCITLLGQLENGEAVAAVTKKLAEKRINIRALRRLSEGALHCLEFRADLPADVHADAVITPLRREILELGQRLNVDIAVQRDDLFRRSKRLVCMDVDSTFVATELIDELAALHGCGEKVAGITARAMRGELDFKAALKERVALLKGLPMAKAEQLLKDIKLNPGAENFARTLKSLGFRVGLVSGGFDFFVKVLKEHFHLDFAFANQLEVKDGLLTGHVTGQIVDAERKAQILRDMAQIYECRLEQSVAIGDGANDMLMLQSAGLGIAYRAKPRLQEVADLSLNRERMDSLLHLMGFSARELSCL